MERSLPWANPVDLNDVRIPSGSRASAAFGASSMRMIGSVVDRALRNCGCEERVGEGMSWLIV